MLKIPRFAHFEVDEILIKCLIPITETVDRAKLIRDCFDSKEEAYTDLGFEYEEAIEFMFSV